MLEADFIASADSDLKVVDSARVSFDKRSQLVDGALNVADAKLIDYLARHNHWTPFAHCRDVFALRMTDADLVRFMLDGNMAGFNVVRSDMRGFYYVNGSLYGWLKNVQYLPTGYADIIAAHLWRKYPVSTEALYADTIKLRQTGGIYPHCQPVAVQDGADGRLLNATFRMHAPVPIRTHCFKHKFGLVENEISRRYVDFDPEFFVPDGWRGRPTNSKQGSSGIIDDPDVQEFSHKGLLHAYDEANEVYRTMIEDGVCPEQARFALSQGMVTSWYWTGDLSAFARFVTQRADDHAQEEVSVLAKKVDAALAERFPVTWAALTQAA